MRRTTSDYTNKFSDILEAGKNKVAEYVEEELEDEFLDDLDEDDEDPTDENRMHKNRLEEIATSYSEDDAQVVIDILIKTHPKIVFKALEKEYTTMKYKLDSILGFIGGNK